VSARTTIGRTREPFLRTAHSVRLRVASYGAKNRSVGDPLADTAGYKSSSMKLDWTASLSRNVIVAFRFISDWIDF